MFVQDNPNVNAKKDQLVNIKRNAINLYRTEACQNLIRQIDRHYWDLVETLS